jgi:hypothetical protein
VLHLPLNKFLEETNGSQVNHVDLDEIDEEESTCTMLRNMSIREVCPQVPQQEQDQSFSIQAQPQHKMKNKTI